MVLIEHNVEAELIGENPLVVVAVKEIGGDFGVAFAVGQIDAQRTAMIRPCIRVGLLGELIDFMDSLQLTGMLVAAHEHCRRGYHLPSMKAKIFSANSLGCSTCGKCPARSMR